MSWASIATLIKTYKLNKVDQSAWMVDTLRRIANGHMQSRIHELMSRNFNSSSD